MRVSQPRNITFGDPAVFEHCSKPPDVPLYCLVKSGIPSSRMMNDDDHKTHADACSKHKLSGTVCLYVS